jgi:hypothetical protein
VSVVFAIPPALFGVFVISSLRDSDSEWSQPLIHWLFAFLWFGVVSAATNRSIFRCERRTGLVPLILVAHGVLNFMMVFGYAIRYRTVSICASYSSAYSCASWFLNLTVIAGLLYDLIISAVILVVLHWRPRVRLL